MRILANQSFYGATSGWRNSPARKERGRREAEEREASSGTRATRGQRPRRGVIPGRFGDRCRAWSGPGWRPASHEDNIRERAGGRRSRVHLDGLQVSGPEGACSMRGPAGSRGLFGRKKGREGGRGPQRPARRQRPLRSPRVRAIRSPLGHVHSLSRF